MSDIRGTKWCDNDGGLFQSLIFSLISENLIADNSDSAD